MVKKKNQDFQKRVDLQVAKILKKEEKKLVKRTAKQEVKRLRREERFKARPVRETVRQIGQVERAGQKRASQIRIFGSKAEQLEIQMVSLNEVPMLQQMDRDRGRLASPPNAEFVRVEKAVTDSFPQ